MDDRQHGSRSGRGCLTQLLAQYDDILNKLQGGDNVNQIYLDYEKAFDKVDHGILLHKLRFLGISGKLGLWIANFLANRRQRVRIENELSNWAPVLSGIPQGSVLGPLLFLIYILDLGKPSMLPNSIPNSVCSVDNNSITPDTNQCVKGELNLFVDDSKIRAKVSSRNEYLEVEQLQNDLLLLNEWSKLNNMRFNGDKFMALCMGPNKDLINSTVYFSGNYDEVIRQVDTCRDLGVEMSADMTFTSQINKAVSKASQKAGWILRTFRDRSPGLLRQLWRSLVEPHLDYCSVLWQPSSLK